MINEVISYSSWESNAGVTSPELLIFLHGAGVLSGSILVATGPASPNNGDMRMSAEEVSKTAAEDLLLRVNDPSPNDMLDINVAMLEVARFPWLRKSVFLRPSEDKEAGRVLEKNIKMYNFGPKLALPQIALLPENH